MDRQGQVKHWTTILVVSIATAIVVVAVFTMTNSRVNQQIEIRPALAALYPHLFVYGSGQFRAQQEHTYRFLPLTIDVVEFTNLNIDEAFGHDNNRFVAARLVLMDQETGQTTVRFWNKDWYDVYKPISTKPGPGGAISRTSTHFVHIRTASGTHAGLLAVEMVVPRT